MMNAMVKHMIEIAGGLIIGSLASDAVDIVIDYTKKKIKNVDSKENKEA